MPTRSKQVDVKIHLEKFSIVDKSSNFRASMPTKYWLRIHVTSPSLHLILREFCFDTAKQRDEQWQNLRLTFGMV